MTFRITRYFIISLIFTDFYRIILFVTSGIRLIPSPIEKIFLTDRRQLIQLNRVFKFNVVIVSIR